MKGAPLKATVNKFRCAMRMLRMGCGWAIGSLLAALPMSATAQATAPKLATPSAAMRIVLLTLQDDPRQERSRLERAVPGHATGAAADGVRLALKDADRALQAASLRLELQVVEVADAQAAAKAAKAVDASSTVALISDLPSAWVSAVSAAGTVAVLNIAAADDALRQAQCAAHVWHLVPSERMRADALAQALVARKWSRVLLLTGPAPEDATRAATVQAAIKRYGLKLVDTKPFKLSADPRERDLANPRLLTQGDYDVVWVVDGEGEFATTLPYRTVLPRPVVGDGGLVAVAWSSKFERFGAPQVSRRLQRQAGRMMGSQDWVAWMAGKAAVAMALTVPRTGPDATKARLQALATMELDGSKGVAMSFRTWDGQLRQPLLLSDGQAVIETVPGDGVMHPRNRLDTLGADAPENLCKARGG